VSAAFTPGPWRVREPGCATVLGMKRHTHFDGSFTDFEAEVARIQPSPMREANARLIAAAPELYEALKALQLQALQSNVNEPSNEWGRDALAQARGALAKARGEAL
jgi:hypothetical protein